MNTHTKNKPLRELETSLATPAEQKLRTGIRAGARPVDTYSGFGTGRVADDCPV